MNRAGRYNESEMLQRTCKFVRVIRGDGLSANRSSNGDKAIIDQGNQTWDKCEGSLCAQWRWHKPLLGKVKPGGLGFCGLAGKD